MNLLNMMKPTGVPEEEKPKKRGGGGPMSPRGR